MLVVQLQINHSSFTKRTKFDLVLRTRSKFYVLLVNDSWLICNCTPNMPITNTNREVVLITAILQYWLHCNQYSSGIWRHSCNRYSSTDYSLSLVSILLNLRHFSPYLTSNASNHRRNWRHIWIVSLWFRRLVSILSKQSKYFGEKNSFILPINQ